MPAYCVPAEPTFVTASERDVWTELRDTLDDDCVLVANLRLTGAEDRELDLLVLVPGAGVVVLEVKGGSVWLEDGGWRIRRGERVDRCSPVDQAREGKYAARDYVTGDPRWGSRGVVAWGHGVVFPHTDLGRDFSTPDLPAFAWHDRSAIGNLAARVRENALRMGGDRRRPSEDDIDTMVEILSGRRPGLLEQPAAEAAERAGEAATRLTQEQMVILQVTRLLRRVEVRGGAGSGKTVLALQKAKDLSRGAGEGARSERVALLCYSIGLAAYLKREVDAWKRQHKPDFVGTFEELGERWGIEMEPESDSDFWENRLPRLMAERAASLPPRARFDSIVVDEAQDFADSWWTSVLGGLRDEEESGVFLFSDENQRLFERFGRPPVQLVPLVLDHNLRNTKQICEAFGPLAPSRMRPLGGDGPSVRFILATSATAIDVADDAAVALLDDWEPGQVALLTTGSRHPVQTELVERHGKQAYWQSFWDGDDVFYGHVLGSKGLERACVVLCVNESGNRDRARERLYVGMSRATDVLVVVGDPQVIRSIGGDAIARSLGI